jgi:S1-C subfamily serine protease
MTPGSSMWWAAMRTMAIASVLSWPAVAHATLVPPFFINSVVALGAMVPVIEVGVPPHLEWRTVGTGFFYGYLIQDDPDPAKRKYETYLVTAKHVVQSFILENKPVSVRVNPKEASSEGREFEIANQAQPGSGTWFCHPNPKVDIAAVPINFVYLKEQGIEPNAFASDLHVADRKKLSELDVTAGDGVFVLGFPMGLSGAQRNYVIVRQGAIARISEMLDKASPSFMIDALVFPGNSGGPVVLRPEITSIANTKSQATSFLVGVVIDYRSYIDTAVSQQTKRPRITFEENSGLAEVLPVDVVNEAIKAWDDNNKPTALDTNCRSPTGP